MLNIKVMKDFFKDEKGNFSSNRLIFVLGMIWAMCISSLFAYIFEWNAGEFIAVFTSNSAVFVGLKLGQKPMEKNK